VKKIRRLVEQHEEEKGQQDLGSSLRGRETFKERGRGIARKS